MRVSPVDIWVNTRHYIGYGYASFGLQWKMKLSHGWSAATIVFHMTYGTHVAVEFTSPGQSPSQSGLRLWFWSLMRVEITSWLKRCANCVSYEIWRTRSSELHFSWPDILLFWIAHMDLERLIVSFTTKVYQNLAKGLGMLLRITCKSNLEPKVVLLKIEP